MNVLLTIRPMHRTDIPIVMEIQAKCYSEVAPESEPSVIAKWAASPSTCFVASQHERVIGYLISLPWRFENPPVLNAATCELPPLPDALYLHDLAVAPVARKAGAGKALVEAFMHRARALKLPRACLIAVQNSALYWQRIGFQLVNPTHSLGATLASYGDNVEYMERQI